MIRRTLIALASAGAIVTAQACGPDFFPDVFVRTNRPDLPARYAQGHLGILQKDFPSADLFVAYRYLSGGTLTPAEQKGWSPTNSLAEQEYDPALQHAHEGSPLNPSVAAWSTTRARYTSVGLAEVDPMLQKKTTTPDGFSYNVTVTNCADDAFRTAAATLVARADVWGNSSPFLRDWIQAQDAVFVNCNDEKKVTPKPAPSGAPVLLQQDRAYQVAASQFYAGDFSAAQQHFDAIAADSASPWHTIAGYVAGRALLRKAALDPITSDTPHGMNRGTLEEAQRHIDQYLATHPPQQWARAAELQRNRIRIRLEPETRTRELAALLTGPGEDWNYQQDVQDVLWLMRAKVPDNLRAEPETYESFTTPDGKPDYRILTPAQAESRATVLWDKAYADSAALRATKPILDWDLTLRARSSHTAAHAFQQWQRTRTLPWLVAALMLAKDTDRPDGALLQAAAEVPAASPAWQTVQYHLARLQLAAGQLSVARARITALQQAQDALPANQQEPSTRNALRSLAMRASTTRKEAFSNLSQIILLSASETYFSSAECKEVMTHRSNRHRCLTPGKEELDLSAARFLNQQAPLTVWIEAANSFSIPQPLRQAIAIQGWTRATLLNNSAAAAALQPLLPQPLQTELAVESPLAPWMTLVRNPGLQPRVDAGVQRAYTYDFVESYRDNWCYNPAEYTQPQPSTVATTAQERAQGEADARAVANIRSVNLGQKVIALVAAHPDDPQAPEALYLVLRMIRYGCDFVHEPNDRSTLATPDTATGDQLLKLRRDTAALMRRYYATNPWTKKAAPYVGEVRPSKA